MSNIANMQEVHTPTPCDCEAETLQILNTIQQGTPSPFSPSQSATTSSQTTSLGIMLSAGRNLVRNWERINGCPKASSHLSPALLRTVIAATDGIVGLYEAGGEAAGLFSSKRGGPDEAPGFAGGVVIQPEQVRLGSYVLDGDEAAVVGRESMRHSLLLMGEVLNDIEKDLGEGEDDDSSTRVHDVEEMRLRVSEATARLLRLLGRINQIAGAA